MSGQVISLQTVREIALASPHTTYASRRRPHRKKNTRPERIQENWARKPKHTLEPWSSVNISPTTAPLKIHCDMRVFVLRTIIFTIHRSSDLCLSINIAGWQRRGRLVPNLYMEAVGMEKLVAKRAKRSAPRICYVRAGGRASEQTFHLDEPQRRLHLRRW